jgi:hypothetical protein
VWYLLLVNLLGILVTQVSAAQAPTVSLNTPSTVTGSVVIMTGTVNPNGLGTGYSLQWGTNVAYDHFGRWVQMPAQATPVAITLYMTDLTTNTLYHYQLAATNSAGQSLSPDMTLTTSADAPQIPAVTANAATDVTSTSATITGTVDPQGFPAAFVVAWGMTTAYNHSGLLMIPIQGLAGPLPVSATISGLIPNTAYHYEIIATNFAGIGYSADLTLTTAEGTSPPPPPAVTTKGAISVTSDSAQIVGNVGSSVSEAVWYFRWGTNTDYGNGTPLNQVSSNSVPTDVSAWLSGLSPGTTYHYQLVATNSGGVSAGADMTFTTISAVSIGGHLFIYTTNNGTVTIIGYQGPGGAVTIPGTIIGLPVTSIGSYAFSSVGLAAVSIPEGVTSIADWAFFLNSGLTNVALPKTLTYIGQYAFNQAFKLTSLTIPDNVTNIDSGAFWSCFGLASVSFGNSVGNIGAQAFGDCALTQVTLPDSVTNLPDGFGDWGGPVGAFSYCNGLTNVIIGKGLAYLGVGTFTHCENLFSVLFRGNAPPYGAYTSPFDMDPFFDATNVTVYYLSGTTGWGATYSGRPAVLWTLPLLATEGSSGVQQGGFGFNIGGTVGEPVVIEATTNLADSDWVTLKTCTLYGGIVRFSDPDSTNYPARLYRVRSP